MTNSECLLECKDRINYAANLFGSRWREEIPFLEGCCEALQTVENGFFSDQVKELISDVFQNYYGGSLEEISNDNPAAEELFMKIGLI